MWGWIIFAVFAVMVVVAAWDTWRVARGETDEEEWLPESDPRRTWKVDP